MRGALFVALLAVPAAMADIQPVAPMMGGLASMDAVWHHGLVFTVGGTDGTTPVNHPMQVYDPVNDTMGYLAYSPSYTCSAAASDGANIYVFGGSDGYGNGTAGSEYKRSIVRVNTETGVSTVMAAQLPLGTCGASATWALGAFWIAGGTVWGPSGFTDSTQVLRWVPGGNVTASSVVLPQQRDNMGGAWDGHYWWLVGGGNFMGGGGAQTSVWRVDLANLTLNVMPPMAWPVSDAGVAWNGTRLVVAGGAVPIGSNYGPTSRIVLYDTLTGTSTVASEVLPEALSSMAAASDGSQCVYAFGGIRTAGSANDGAYRIGPAGCPARPSVVVPPPPPPPAPTSEPVRVRSAAYPTAQPVQPERGHAAPLARIAIYAQVVPTRFDGYASSDVDGLIVAWAWDFDDGSVGTGPLVRHEFKPGSYNVRLTVTDDEGLTSSDTLLVRVP